MKVAGVVFNVLAAFFFIVGVVYGFWAQDWAGTTVLLFTGFMTLLVGFYATYTSRRLTDHPSDDQLAERIEDSADYLGSLTLDQWRDVLAVEGRANVLACAASGGWPAVVAYLDAIKGAGAAPGGFPLGSPPGGASSP